MGFSSFLVIRGSPLARSMVNPNAGKAFIPSKHRCLLLGCTKTGTDTDSPSAAIVAVNCAVITSSRPPPDPSLPKSRAVGSSNCGSGWSASLHDRAISCSKLREIIVDWDPVSTMASTATPPTFTGMYTVGPTACEVPFSEAETTLVWEGSSN